MTLNDKITHTYIFFIAAVVEKLDEVSNRSKMSKDGEDRLKSEERMLNSLFGFNFKRIKKGQEAAVKIEPCNAGNF